MSAYTRTPGWFRPIRGTIRYEALQELRWEVGAKGSGLFIIVPRGFIFDVSIPRLLRWAMDPHDRRFLKAAALHDAIRGDGWDRVTAGAIFHAALKADGVGRLERLFMWLAVSLYRWE